MKNIGIVAGLTVVSRVLGLIREVLIAQMFHISLLASAFFTAFRLPNLFRRLLAEGSLTAAFVPTLQEVIQEQGRPGAFALLNNVASWLALVTTTLVALAMLVFSQTWLLGQHDEKWGLAAHLTVILFPYLIFVSLAAVFSATLQVLERFTEPALSPIWLNLVMIASLGAAGWGLADTGLEQIHWLCAGALVGGFLQMAVPAAVLIREGWRPRWDLARSPRLRAIALMMVPGIFGTAIYQVNQYVSQVLAYNINESGAAALNYASRLMELPIGVFAIAIATVVYPLIARHAVDRNFEVMGDDYRKGLRLILMINVPAAIGLLLLSEPIVRLIFEHGLFTASATALTGPILTLLAIGLPCFSIVSLTTRAFYAMRDTRTPVRIALVNFFINIGLSLVLMRYIAVAGLALASTIAVLVQMLVLQSALTRRRPELSFAPLWRSVLKILGASIAMGVVVGLGWIWTEGSLGSSSAADLLAVFGLIPLGIAVYAITLWAFKIEGRDEVAALFAKLRGKFSK